MNNKTFDESREHYRESLPTSLTFLSITTEYSSSSENFLRNLCFSITVEETMEDEGADTFTRWARNKFEAEIEGMKIIIRIIIELS